MRSRDALTAELKEHMLYRGLRPLRGQLAFAYKGHIVHLAVDESLYRGPFVAVLEQGRPVREFRAQSGQYDWDAIAATVIDVAEGRGAHGRSSARGNAIDAANQKLAADLRSMLGPGGSGISIEPSGTTPGRVRVKLQEVELDPLAVLQLFAALSRALPAAVPAH